MTVRFQYVGHSGETIVGMEPADLTDEDYDALDYEHQQAVLLNRGSDGGPLYIEVHEPPATPIENTADAADSGGIPPTSDQPAAAAEPDLNQPLDDAAPAEGAH